MGSDLIHHVKRGLKSLLNKKQKVVSHAYQAQQKLVPKAQVIFDVGANTGLIAKQYLTLFPNATIHAFEPFFNTFTTLQSNANNRNIIPNQIAISDIMGTETFYLNESNETNSLLKSNQINDQRVNALIKTKQEITIPTTTIDSYTTKHQINHIDILKLDIQGGELKALKGAENMLKSKRINLIYTEIEFQQVYKDQPLFRDIESFLNKHGYFLYNLYHLKSLSSGVLGWGDAIFVTKDRLSI